MINNAILIFLIDFNENPNLLKYRANLTTVLSRSKEIDVIIRNKKKISANKNLNQK